MNDHLGRLARVAIKDVWPTEDGHFTPWLGEPHNIEVLGQALNMDLEVEEVEQYVGSYRADIVCRDTEDGALVIIENQYNKTDHKHIGQLLTYLAGTEAKTAIWIAEQFGDEHRETIDWLNQHTPEEFRFFGLEIELWRIAQSPPAPKFNIISKPNNWTRSVRRATRTAASKSLTQTSALYLRYWSAFRDFLEQHNSHILGNRSPRPQHWMTFAPGLSGFHMSALISVQKNRIGAELCLNNDHSADYFALLLRDQATIQAALGETYEWRALPERKASRIMIFKSFDPHDEENWPEQHLWLAERLEKIRHVFEPRLKALDLSDLETDGL